MISDKIIKLILYASFIFFFSFTFLGLFASFGLDVGKGNHIGYITEIEESGMFFRQPVVTIVNVQTTMSAKDSSYDYSVNTDSQEYLLLKQALNDNSKIYIEYHITHFEWVWNYHSRVIITKVEILGD